MIIGILADIHDAAEPLATALARFRDLGVERIVSLGDVFETIRPGDPGVAVARILAAAGAVGVWGNHDFGLSHDVSEIVAREADPAILAYASTLKPHLVIKDCRFSHIEPWLDPTSFTDLWYFDGAPTDRRRVTRNFEAVPERILFVGHYHHWAVAGEEGPLDVGGVKEIRLHSEGRYLVLVPPVVRGWSLVFDTTRSELTVLRGPAASEDPASG